MRCHNYTSMDPFLRFAKQKQKDIIMMIRDFVECESPSDHAPGVNRFVELLADRVSELGRVKTFNGGRFGKHARVEFQLPGSKKRGQILALGHSDTVWTLGTLKTMPFREAKGRLWAPWLAPYSSRSWPTDAVS